MKEGVYVSNFTDCQFNVIYNYILDSCDTFLVPDLAIFFEYQQPMKMIIPQNKTTNSTSNKNKTQNVTNSTVISSQNASITCSDCTFLNQTNSSQFFNNLSFSQNQTDSFSFCQSGYFASSTQCVLCPQGCIKCMNLNFCEFCDSNYIIFEARCISTFSFFELILGNRVVRNKNAQPTNTDETACSQCIQRKQCILEDGCQNCKKHCICQTIKIKNEKGKFEMTFPNIIFEYASFDQSNFRGFSVETEGSGNNMMVKMDKNKYFIFFKITPKMIMETFKCILSNLSVRIMDDNIIPKNTKQERSYLIQFQLAFFRL